MSDPLGPLDYVSDEGDLTINFVPMRTPAWSILDLTPLWMPAALRGANRIVPGAAGVIVNPKRKTETRHELVLVMTGGVDISGVAYPNRWHGLYTNMEYLKANVLDPPTGVGIVSRTAELTLPDASTLTAEIQVEDFQPVNKVNAIHVYTMGIVIPMGEFS